MGILIFIGVFVSVSFVALIVMQLIGQSVNPNMQRMNTLWSDYGTQNETIIDTGSILKKKNEINPKIEKLMERLSFMAPKNPSTIKRKSQLLIQAGYPTEQAYKVYASVKVAASLIFFILGLY